MFTDLYNESDIQEDLLLLSGYTREIKLVREVAYKSVSTDNRDRRNNKYINKGLPKTRRFDLLYKDKKAKSLFIIELKKDIITAITISEIIGERGYIEILENIKEEDIEYKQLIFSNPKNKGITIGAKRLISRYSEISYIPVEEIGETLFKCYQMERIDENSWRDQEIRKRFKRILL